MASQAHLELAQGPPTRSGRGSAAAPSGSQPSGGSELLPAVGSVRIGDGRALYEWNELDAAARHLTEGVELAEPNGRRRDPHVGARRPLGR